MSESCIYFIQGANGGPIKIGRAKNALRRLFVLQTGSPVRLLLLVCAPGGAAEELALHNHFSAARILNEWFEPTLAILEMIEIVRRTGQVPIACPAQIKLTQGPASPFLFEIEAFLALPEVRLNGITATSFGLSILNDGKFVSELKTGRNVRMDTAHRVRAHIKAEMIRLRILLPEVQAA